MTTEEFNHFFGDFMGECRKIHATKGKEYSGNGDRLANFKRLAARLTAPPETVCLIYGTKHLDALASLTEHIETEKRLPPSISEPIEGRFHDAVNYLVLLAALCEERRLVEKAEAQPGLLSDLL